VERSLSDLFLRCPEITTSCRARCGDARGGSRRRAHGPSRHRHDAASGRECSSKLRCGDRSDGDRPVSRDRPNAIVRSDSSSQPVVAETTLARTCCPSRLTRQQVLYVHPTISHPVRRRPFPCSYIRAPTTPTRFTECRCFSVWESRWRDTAGPLVDRQTSIENFPT